MKKEQQQYAPHAEDDEEDEDAEALVMNDAQIEAFAKAVAELMRKKPDEASSPR